jgi:HSP20 family protein
MRILPSTQVNARRTRIGFAGEVARSVRVRPISYRDRVPCWRIEMTETAIKTPVEPKRQAPTTREEVHSPIDALRREVDRLFEDFRPAGWRLPVRRPSAFELTWPRMEGWQLAPAMDMVDKNNVYEITAELPGLDEKNVEIKLSNGNLTIKGEKKEEKEEREKEYYLSERRYGSFQRTFRVPESVDNDKIDASFKRGVLTVTLPKSPAAKLSEKQISVKAG